MLEFVINGVVSYGPTVLASVGAAAIAKRVYDAVDITRLGESISRTILTNPVFERVPIVGRLVAKEKATLRKEKMGLIKDALKVRGVDIGSVTEATHPASGKQLEELSPELPSGSMPLEEIAKELGVMPDELAVFRQRAERRAKEESESNTFASGAVYSRDVSNYVISMMVDSKYSYTNHMHSDMWPELLEYRARLVNWIGNLLHAPKSAPVQGLTTAGGTLSIFESVNAHLSLYLEKHPSADRSKLSVVGSIDTHEAFRKACARLGIQFVGVPVNKDTRKVDIKAMRVACTGITAATPILLVSNQVAFPFGISDDTTAVSELALEIGAGCHVDMCLGSIYEADLDGTKQDFVFDNPGVTAASFDSHKFCEVDKGLEGSSVVIFRNAILKMAAAHSGVDWTGGAYATAHSPGSVGGAGIAKAYYTVLSVGREEYANRRDIVFEVTKDIKSKVMASTGHLISEGIITDEDLVVVGEPNHAVVGFRGRLAHAVANLMKHTEYTRGSKEFVALGFSDSEPTDIQRQLANTSKFAVNDLKEGFHQCTTMAYAMTPDFSERFFQKLVMALRICHNHPEFVKQNSTASFYCTAAKVPKMAMWALHGLAKEYTRLEGLTEEQLVNEYERELSIEGTAFGKIKAKMS